MASLKEIKGRIISVQTTQKTTSAMRMVASAKLHRTQTITQTFLEYVSEMQKIADSLQLSTPDGSLSVPDGAPSPSERAGERLILIPISSSSGLCGAFNSNIAKATFRRIQELESQGVTPTVIPVGKKIAHELQKAGIECNTDYIHLAEGIGNPKVDAYSQAASLVTFLSQHNDANVEIIYHKFKNMASQIIVTDTLDSSLSSGEGQGGASGKGRGESSYLFEPSPSLLLAELRPKMLNSKMYSILLDSVTSEHAARMMAMQTADDNAKELLQELTLLYNKSRQQAITNELIDIMGGKVAE